MSINKTSAGISYTRGGSGPPVVLLHGWCLNRSMWMYQEELLSERFDVIAPDLPGFGSSSGLDHLDSLEGYADALDQFISELDLGRVSIAGFAFGAAVAMTAVAKGSDRIGALALVAPPSAATAPYERMPRAMRRDWPGFAEASAVAILGQEHSGATGRWLADMFAATSLGSAIGTVRLLAKFEPESIAREVGVPTLLIHGEDDEIVPASCSEGCATMMPNATLVMVPNAGHLVPVDQKGVTHTLISDFFADDNANHPS